MGPLGDLGSWGAGELGNCCGVGELGSWGVGVYLERDRDREREREICVYHNITTEGLTLFGSILSHPWSI